MRIDIQHWPTDRDPTKRHTAAVWFGDLKLMHPDDFVCADATRMGLFQKIQFELSKRGL